MTITDAIRLLSPHLRRALVESYASRAESAADPGLAGYYSAMSAAIVEQHNAAAADAGAVLLAARDGIAKAEVAELGAVFLDADGNEIRPTG